MNQAKLKPYLVDYLDAQGQKIDGQLIFARDSTAASMAVLDIIDKMTNFSPVHYPTV